MTNEGPYKIILSLDGGGIRGLISARILHEIEKRTGKHIHQLFDLIVGTSTGGILATALARNRPCTADQLVELYSTRGREIFSRSFWKGVTSLGGLSDEKYDAEPLESILKEVLGNAQLQHTVPDIVVTSYDIERREPYFFKTSKARNHTDRKHLLRDVARATSAAPTYFEVSLLDGSNGRRRALIDGGVFANNPSMIALSEALASGAAMDEIVLCAVGTGKNERAIPYEEAKDWGPLGWVRPILSIMMDGMSDSAHYHAAKLLPGPHGSAKSQRYFRFDIRLTSALDDLDATHQANIAALLREAEEIIDRQDKELEQLAEKLKN